MDDNLLSYEKLNYWLERYKSRFSQNVNVLEYLYLLLKLEVSALDITKYNEYKDYNLNAFEKYKFFVIYNLFWKSHDLISNVSQKIIVNRNFNNLGYGINVKDTIYNVYSLNFFDIPTICLYQENSAYNSVNSSQTAPNVMCAREAILDNVLLLIDLQLSDFNDVSDSYGVYKKIIDI